MGDQHQHDLNFDHDDFNFYDLDESFDHDNLDQHDFDQYHLNLQFYDQHLDDAAPAVP